MAQPLAPLNSALDRARSTNAMLSPTPKLRVGVKPKPVPEGLPPAPSPSYIRADSSLEEIPDGRPPSIPSSQTPVAILDAHSGAPVHGRAALVAATAAGREILEEGTKLSVYWPGSDEWFATCILGHRATIEEGVLVFKHRCEYPGGFIEHDLGEVDFELLERPSDMDEIDQENLEAAQLNALDEGLSESAKPPVVTITGSDKRKRGVLGALHLGGSRRGRKDVALVSEQRA